MKSGLLIPHLALIFTLTIGTPLAYAGDGHDHGDAPPANSGDGPKRLPDGSVFLPKPTQRQLGVRTTMATNEALPRTIELSGKVVMDPNAGGKVQALIAGRIIPGPKGLPYPGQTVRKGELLAYVTPEAGSNGQSLAESRLRRLRELSDTVPRKTIEEAEAAVASERLIAPATGVIAMAAVVAGQVVESRETLYEIIDPERLLVEALSFDPALPDDIAQATLAVGSLQVPLQLQGAARSLREQALPITFRGEGSALKSLAVGQPVQVFVHTKNQVTGIGIPASALMKNPSNQTIVWIKAAPERFEARVVTHEPLDGNRVAITTGLQPGDLVVVRASGLVNQIR